MTEHLPYNGSEPTLANDSNAQEAAELQVATQALITGDMEAYRQWCEAQNARLQPAILNRIREGAALLMQEQAAARKAARRERRNEILGKLAFWRSSTTAI